MSNYFTNIDYWIANSLLREVLYVITNSAWSVLSIQQQEHFHKLNPIPNSDRHVIREDVTSGKRFHDWVIERLMWSSAEFIPHRSETLNSKRDTS